MSDLVRKLDCWFYHAAAKMKSILQELGRPKCYAYWPQDPGEENKLVFGDVST